MSFPSPAKDYEDEEIDLERILKPHPSATFYFRVKNDAMKEDSIPTGALAIVDRSLTPKIGDIIIATHEGDNIMRRLEEEADGRYLVASNQKFKPIKIYNELHVWGVVSSIISNPNNLSHVNLG